MDPVGYPDNNSGVRRLSTDVAGNIGFATVLALAALLRVWHLNQAGFGTQYYAAGVLSMLESWHNFFFNSFDPAGFVSIDKPPLALWLQVASARVLGFSGMSIHLPQVIEGVAAIGLLYYLVRRRFGTASGLLAALFFAITPISVAIDRSNNTDSALVLGLLASAWALSLAVESASLRMLLASMVLLGIAFNVKMLAAIVVVPPFMAAYFFGTALPAPRKAAHLLLALAVLAVVSLLWCLAYDLTPPPSRPYAGSTKNNSMLELVIGENGVRRFVRLRRFGAGRNGPLPGAQAATPGPPAANTPVDGGAASAPANPAAGARAADRVPVGLLRLTSPLLAAQMGWLYPLSAIGVAVSLWRRRLRLPLEPSDTALLLWAGWAVTYGLVLSYAGGIFHPYYLAAMAPPVCALAGIGVVHLWAWYREGGRRALLLPVTLLLAAAWQIYIGHGYLDWQLSNPQRGTPSSADTLRHLQNALIAGSIAAAVLGAGGLFLARSMNPARTRGWPLAALAAGIVAVILIPTAWAFGSMQSDGNANSPTAQPPGSPADRGSARGRGNSADPQLVAFLADHYRDERFLLATLSAQQAAPIIIATGKAVMAIGGFAGTDPILTPESLSQMVQQGQLRFALIGGNGGAGFANGAAGFAAGAAGFAPGGAAAQAPLVQWVREHGSPVEPALWRSPRAQTPDGAPRALNRRNPGAGGFNGPAAAQLFDLRPDAAQTGVAPEGPRQDPAQAGGSAPTDSPGSGH
jgi:4-amino-4-deoxy-L-arabinose transferase-like glycosyltransferase